MQPLTRAIGGAVLAAALLVIPSQVDAQECRAQIQPAEVDAGETATRLQVTLPQPIGAVERLQAPQSSGLAVASPRDIPRIALAADEEATPIAMGDAENHWMVWVSTNASQPGTHAVTFVGTEGSCSANLTVRAPR